MKEEEVEEENKENYHLNIKNYHLLCHILYQTREKYKKMPRLPEI